MPSCVNREDCNAFEGSTLHEHSFGSLPQPFLIPEFRILPVNKDLNSKQY